MAIVRLSDLTKRYGREVAVDHVSLSIDRGEIVGLIGPNGAGKTTMLRMIGGMLRPSAGAVHVASDVTANDIRYYGGEHTLPPNVSARRWLALWNVPGSLSVPVRPMGTLSRGTRQRIGLEAMATHATKLLLLDEPWESLDPDASRWLSDTLVEKRRAGTAVIVSSHRIHDLADVCDRCVFMVKGRLDSEAVAFADSGVRLNRSAVLFEAFDRARGRS